MPLAVQTVRVDVHQHLWTEPLLDALGARQRLPFVTRRDRTAIVHCAGEQAYGIDEAGDRFQGWGPVALDRPDAGDVDRLIARGCAGITLSAGSLATPEGLDHVDPRLRVLFALLAGGPPLLGDRLAARGGPPIELRDRLTFYETSSFGSAAIEAMVDLVGVDQLVYGSDRPVVEPTPTGWDSTLQTNAARFVAGHPTHAARATTVAA